MEEQQVKPSDVPSATIDNQDSAATPPVTAAGSVPLAASTDSSSQVAGASPAAISAPTAVPAKDAAGQEAPASMFSTSGLSSWAKNLKIPQPSSSQESPTGKNTFARFTSGLGLRLSPKAAQQDDSAEGSTSPTTAQSGVFGSLTKGIVDSSKNAVKAVQVKARHMVSQNKRRYQEGGFDLDMTYITENIIAMGFPAGDLSSGLFGYFEGFYRNHMEEVIRFFEMHHKGKYKVYNLCSERLYDASLFEGKVACFPFDDHNCPPMQLVISFCHSAYSWLNREEDRHLPAAETPPFSPDVCVIESTYGIQQHQPRDVRERRFTEIVSSTVSQGGRVLIPAYALGRAQELLLILDEYWSNHPELHKIPIYYASALAKRCMAVYQTHISSMNENIRNKFGCSSNPFNFKHVESLNSIDSFHDVGPSVVMASPGGLQSGLSRQLFDRWCEDGKNACVIPGYVVAGTLAKTIINEPREVTLANGLTAPLNMQVHYISFSAHADFPQTSAFLGEIRPPNIVLVHGEANEMARLKQRLVSQFDGTNTNVVSPKNCQSVEMFFRSEKMAKAVGSLAEKVPNVGDSVSGLLLTTKGFTYQVMDPDELRVYTRAQLSSANITQRISVPYSGSFEVVRYRLNQIYESVEESAVEESDVPALVVHQRVTVRQDSETSVTLQWSSDPISDMVSDSVVAAILNISRKGPKGVRAEEAARTKEETERMAHKVVHALMVSLFGDVKAGQEGELVISVDGDVAHLDGKSGDVECENAALKERIETAFRRIQGAVRPIPLSAS